MRGENEVGPLPGVFLVPPVPMLNAPAPPPLVDGVAVAEPVNEGVELKDGTPTANP